MEKVWLQKYPPTLPAEINPDAFSSIVDVFHNTIKTYPDRKAFTNLGHVITFAEFDALSLQFASYLQNVAGLKPGDHLAIQLPNLIQYPVVLFGALRAGLVVVNTNPQYTPREMNYQYRDSKVKAVVILANFASKLEEVLADTEIKTVIVTEVGDCLPPLKRLFINLFLKYVKKAVPPFHLPGSVKFTSAMARGAKHAFKPVEIKSSDVAFLQYTGGTTGVSKGAMLSHRNMVANMEQISACFLAGGRSEEEIIITALPLYHVYALTVNLLQFVAFAGLNVLITDPRDMPAFFKEMRKWKFTTLTGVNTLFNGMVHHPDFDPEIFKYLKRVSAGGMALQGAVGKLWKEKTGIDIIEGYGMTETSPVTHSNPVVGENRIGTIGMPVPSTEVRIVNDAVNDKLEDMPPGERGELCIKGPQVMLGYWNQPEETAKAIQDGWMRTGDIAIMDPDGYFRIVDRKKDMILVSGFKVFPNEVEDVIMNNPKVLEVAAVGVPDDKSGEVVKIFVVKKDPSLTEDELRAFAKENFTGYKRPHYIEFRDSLPKSNVGKILRRPLRDEAIAQHAQAK